MSAVNYQISELIKEVRVVLDENEASTPLSSIGDTDQLQTDDIITTCLKKAFELVYNIAPLWTLTDILKKKEDTVSKRYSNGFSLSNGSIFKVPDDCLRPYSFICSDWDLPVTEFFDRTAPEYKVQSCDFAGVRGHKSRPLVFIGNNPIKGVAENEENSNILEIYSTSATDDCYLTYVPTPSFSGSSISIPDKLVNAIVYTTAYLYLNTVGKIDLANVMNDIAKKFLLNINDEEK